MTGCEAVRQEASKYGGWNADIVAAISAVEGFYKGKRCNVKATGDKHLKYKQAGRIYGYSVSALQVRILPGREHCDKHSLAINVKCAHRIWKDQGYGAWTMYTNGKYREFLR